MVMQYAKKGSLRKLLNKHYKILTWKDKLYILYFYFNKEQRVNIDTALFKCYFNEMKNLKGFKNDQKFLKRENFCLKYHDGLTKLTQRS